MDEEIPRLQERPFLEQLRDIRGLDYSSLQMCRSRRSMKRDESKETYKLPHRLIEKKRRDRINECIAQLKDLLPEHLKLTTLGHLEKAVVLELTLKHLKTLTALTEQQHQTIIALQNGERSLKSPPQSDLDAFHSGFQACTKEVLYYLSRCESWAAREQRCVQLVSHLHSVCARFLPSSPLLIPKLRGGKGTYPPHSASPGGQRQHPGGGLKQESQPNCVPVIRRTQNWNGHPNAPLPSSGTELAGENDTDTDSGYGGECERSQGGLVVKQEPSGDGDEAPAGAKRRRLESSSPSGVLSPEQAAGPLGRPDAALLNSLMALGVGAGGVPVGPLFGQPPAAPFCLPFYFISPSAAAAYVQPFLDKIGLEKSLYPAGAAGAPIPVIYPGISVQPAAAFHSHAAAAAAAATMLTPAAEKGSSVSAAARFPAELASPPQPPPRLFPCKAAGPNADADRLSPKPRSQPSREKHL
ncbi:class E basic helix-loop-helix protein 41 [Candoia aspera]|uniref:class E basic helix-loop-helix protein 41 n=1 Tax=Candoia aspera TaxID=51853 RepID=UPI002FD7FD09